MELFVLFIFWATFFGPKTKLNRSKNKALLAKRACLHTLSGPPLERCKTFVPVDRREYAYSAGKYKGGPHFDWVRVRRHHFLLTEAVYPLPF